MIYGQEDLYGVAALANTFKYACQTTCGFHMQRASYAADMQSSCLHTDLHFQEPDAWH